MPRGKDRRFETVGDCSRHDGVSRGEMCFLSREKEGERKGYGNLVDLLLQVIIFVFERVAELFDFQLVGLCDF